MAAKPERKISTYRKGKRFATKKIGLVSVVRCKNCNQMKKHHHRCPNCGK